jgi:competence protein ComEC
MERNSLLVTAGLISFILGVYIASVFFHGAGVGGFFILLSFGALACGAVLRDRKAVVLSVCLAFVALGVFRYEFWVTRPIDSALLGQVGVETTLSGFVAEEPDVREDGTRLVIALEYIESIEGESSMVRGRVEVFTERYPYRRYGDRLTIVGVPEIPEKFSGSGGREFNYPMYLKTRGVDLLMFRPTLIARGEGAGNPVRAGLFTFKNAFLEKLSLALPEPESGLAGGILVGSKQSLGKEWTERFRETGLAHIVVLSGYNMTIVAEWLGKLFLFLGFYGSITVSSVGIILFALLAGLGATVVRAALMALIVLFARLTGRTYFMGRALLLTGTGMIIENPGILAHDPSFQLSFLASLGLVFAAPPIERKVPWLGKHPRIKEVIVATLATQILVLPLLVFQTGSLSLLALPANILVLPLIPAAMLASFAAGVATAVFPPLATTFGFPAWSMLSFVLEVARIGSELPLASIPLPGVSGPVLVVIYLTISFFLYLSWKNGSRE